MKVFAVAPLLSLAFLLALPPFIHGEADRYKVEIDEKGTRFSEEIDVNEKGDTAVFRVPSHNNIDGADFYHDFKMRVTVTRIPSRKVCYISEMDSSLSSSGKLKEDLERAALQPGKLPVTTKSHMRTVTGPADRLLLTKEVLEFCGSLPIYNTDISPTGNDPNNDTAIIQTGRQRRQTGSIEVRTFTACNKNKPLSKVASCFNTPNWNLSCRMRRGNCYYLVECKKINTRYSWKCERVHLTYSIAACCEFICP